MLGFVLICVLRLYDEETSSTQSITNGFDELQVLLHTVMKGQFEFTVSILSVYMYMLDKFALL